MCITQLPYQNAKKCTAAIIQLAYKAEFDILPTEILRQNELFIPYDKLKLLKKIIIKTLKFVSYKKKFLISKSIISKYFLYYFKLKIIETI